MTRLRTYNRRKRAHILKRGGIYSLRRHQTGPTWADREGADIEEEIRRAFTGWASGFSIRQRIDLLHDARHNVPR